MDVDEAGRDDQALRVDDARGPASSRGATATIVSPLIADIRDEPRIAGAVDDPSAANDHVEGRGLCPALDLQQASVAPYDRGRESSVNLHMIN